MTSQDEPRHPLGADPVDPVGPGPVEPRAATEDDAAETDSAGRFVELPSRSGAEPRMQIGPITIFNDEVRVARGDFFIGSGDVRDRDAAESARGATISADAEDRLLETFHNALLRHCLCLPGSPIG